MKSKISLQNGRILIAAIFLIVGFAAGFFVDNLVSAKPASAQEIEKAKNEIVGLYKDKAVDACWRVNDGSNLAADKYELTYRNIQINNAANRAIITDCGDNSTLLAKNSSQEWIATNVNITNFNRINPVWQKECGLEDITVADDQVRQENSAIDAMNLQECKQLKEN